MPSKLAVCTRQTDNQLIAAECHSLTGGEPDENGLAFCDTLKYVERSCFIRHGVEIIAQAPTFEELCNAVQAADFDATDFRIEWMKHAEDCSVDRMEATIGIADAIEKYYPNLDNPQHRFLLLARQDGFVFGEIVAESGRAYQDHLSKPYRTSSALPPRLARAAINLAPPEIASVVDPCCGSGTIPIEAASMGLAVYGADRDPLAAQIAQANLNHFGYAGRIEVAEASQWGQKAEVLVTDLPYGINLARVEVDDLRALLANAARLAPVAVILAAQDLTWRLTEAGFTGIELFRHRTNSRGNSVTRVVHRARSEVFEA
jgi:tRNA G10  N-methylase Trm11